MGFLDDLQRGADNLTKSVTGTVDDTQARYRADAPPARLRPADLPPADERVAARPTPPSSSGCGTTSTPTSPRTPAWC